MHTRSLGIQYLGAATQLTDKYGFYNGNENTTNVPEHVIEAGRQIMENGGGQGFFGVAGFDLLVDEDDNVYAIDLNFRQNGSTSMLLLANELNSGYQKFYSYHSKVITHFFNTILKYVKEGSLCRYHIMMVIGTLKMKLNQGLAVFGMEIQKKQWRRMNAHFS